MDENQQDIITKLKFLGKIGKGEKINVKELTLQTEGLITKASRTLWYTDNRNNAQSFIQTTIQAGFSLINNLTKNNSNGAIQLVNNILNDIRQAKIGITNLKTTYSDDTFFCCSIDTYVETLSAKLVDFETMHANIIVPDITDNTDIVFQFPMADSNVAYSNKSADDDPDSN